MLPEPTERLRFRPLEMAGLDDVAGLLSARDVAAAHGIEHLVALVRPENTPSQAVARSLGMEVERTAPVHGAEALVLGMRLRTT